jgi:hypothetical protein
VAGEQSYFAIGAAIWAEVFVLSLGASLGSSRFFFGHILPAVYSRRIKVKAGQPFAAIRRYQSNSVPSSSRAAKNYPAIAQPDACIG